MFKGEAAAKAEKLDVGEFTSYVVDLHQTGSNDVKFAMFTARPSPADLRCSVQAGAVTDHQSVSRSGGGLQGSASSA